LLLCGAEIGNVQLLICLVHQCLSKVTKMSLPSGKYTADIPRIVKTSFHGGAVSL